MLQYFLRTRTLVFWGRRRFLTTPGIIVSIRAVDMDALWDLIYGPYSDFADCPRNVRYRKRNSQLMNHVQFSCPWIWTTPHLRSSFMMLTFFKRLLTRCFVERSSNQVCLVFLPYEIQMTRFWKESHRSDIVNFSVPHTKGMCLFAVGSDVSFEILIKVVSARFFCCEVPIFFGNR